MKMNPSITIRLTVDGKAFWGPGPAQLLGLVKQHRSLHRAAAAMEMSYSKAWRMVNNVEEAIGAPILLRKRGGAEGGSSVLTPEGEALLDAYTQFAEKLRQDARRRFVECFAGVTDGEPGMDGLL